MADPTLLLTALKAVTVVLGLAILVLGAKAWRASRRKPLLYLTAGMAIMTLGAVSEGLAYRSLGWSLDNSHIFEAVVTLVAFAFLVYSLYA